MSDLGPKFQSTLTELATTITNLRKTTNHRLLIAIAGPPGAGKSTLSHHLCRHLNTHQPNSTIIIPMDGFHLDNAILSQRGQLSRKGSPPTFDVAGFRVLLDRLVNPSGVEVVIPVFDRKLDLARAGGDVVLDCHKICLVEGNYLLVDQEPWKGLHRFFDLTVFVKASKAELERRLVQRWLDYDRSMEQSVAWVNSNDIPNVVFTLERSVKPTITVDNE